jgi:hypothetical protein
MIQPFVDKFMAAKESMLADFIARRPEDYEDLFKRTIAVLANEEDYGESPDPKRIHTIDDGDYQGTLLFMVAANGYQPSTYWYAMVYYGSCSGCDTFKDIQNYSDEPTTPEQAEQYWTLCLHMVQSMKRIGREEE